MDDTLLWNDEKNEWLRATRGLSFELVEEAIAAGEVVDDFPHPSSQRSHQRILVFALGRQHVAVPYVWDGTTRFLKTMYFSRDLDEKYGG